jgi:hypothetical protein
VNPYYSIATTYGFANYMFQTNEGPSMVAHQFLITGTSAPVAPGVGGANGEWWDFVRDNPNGNGNNDPDNHSGWPSVYQAPWIQPDRTPLSSQLTYECYAHDSLMTGSNCTNGVCDKYPNLTWTYYSPLDGTAAGAEYIWDAPEAIPEVCYGENDTTPAPAACGSVNGGTEWNSHMVFYDAYNNAEPIPIFTDISNCKLANISWIIPDLAWSDHPSYDGTVSPPLGPSWVASIVNAIGQSYSNSNQKCDYWGTSGAGGNVVQPTAIFVTWDDWGGFYDHIQPYEVLTGVNNGTPMNPIWSCPPPATNQWGCGNTYGFRVPLLVVSEFTGTKSGANYTGYISGPCTPPNCPNTTKIYQHDFGSILAFTENNFGLQNIDQSGDNGYADYNALDWDSGHKISPLSDFFRLYTGPSSAGRPFVQVPSGYDSSFFENYYLNGGTPAGPDTD